MRSIIRSAVSGLFLAIAALRHNPIGDLGVPRDLMCLRLSSQYRLRRDGG